MGEPNPKAAGQGKLPARDAESLGWLAQSSLQPKKRKEIEGVSATSLVALRAELYKTQQQASLVREGKVDPEELRARRRAGGLHLERGRNAGVQERDRRDRLEIKTEAGRLDESRAALERKAALYDRLAAGGGGGGGGGDEAGGEEAFEVDFLLKRQRGGGHAVDTAELAAHTETGGLISGDMAMERERRAWEAEVEGNIAEETALAARRKEKKELISELVGETVAGRERAAALRAAREAAERASRERLKEAFLKKQLAQARQRQQQQGAAASGGGGGGGAKTGKRP